MSDGSSSPISTAVSSSGESTEAGEDVAMVDSSTSARTTPDVVNNQRRDDAPIKRKNANGDRDSSSSDADDEDSSIKRNRKIPMKRIRQSIEQANNTDNSSPGDDGPAPPYRGRATALTRTPSPARGQADQNRASGQPSAIVPAEASSQREERVAQQSSGSEEESSAPDVSQNSSAMTVEEEEGGKDTMVVGGPTSEESADSETQALKSSQSSQSSGFSNSSSSVLTTSISSRFSGSSSLTSLGSATKHEVQNDMGNMVDSVKFGSAPMSAALSDVLVSILEDRLRFTC
jgi:hypothetical protein